MKSSNHLTDQEIEQYAGANRGLEINDRSLQSHIGRCGYCRSRLLQAEQQELGILETGVGTSKPGPKCPAEETLQEFAMGTCAPELSRQIVLHVADCSYCAPLLKAYLEALEEPEPAPSLLRRLRSRFQFFPQLPVLYRGVLAGSLAAVLFGIVAGPSIISAYKLNSAQHFATAFFGEQPPSELRVTWSPYPSESFQTLAERCPSPDDYPDFASASQLATEKLNSADPKWIRLRGRVKLLYRCQGDDAVKLLTTAVEKGLNDPATEIDLAVAYFQRDTEESGKGANSKNLTTPAPMYRPPNPNAPGGQTEGPSFSNLSESLELLNKVLREPAASPDQKAIVWFDLAVVYEKMLFWDQAVMAWKRYLALDTAGKWHDEALKRLEKANAKIPPPKPQGYREPEFFLRHAGDPDVQQSVEDYQDIALRTWLVDANANDASTTALAIRKTAEMMEELHRDSWMSDFFNARRPGDLPAVQALSSAITYNKHGQYTLGAKEANKAAIAFHQYRNSPGELRARFESVYARQRLLDENPCVEQAKGLEKELFRTRYVWLQIQVALEQAVCLNFRTEVKTARDQIAKANQLAIGSNFHILSLRVQHLSASIQVSNDCDETWPLTKAGLEQYWQGPSSPIRLYEFYSRVKQCMEHEKLWFADEAIERRLIAILEKEIDRNDENFALEVTAHRALAQILTALDDDGAAEDQLREAAILAQKVQEVAASIYEIPIELELADLALDREDTETAFARIQTAKQNLPPNSWLLLKFLRVSGDIQFGRQQLPEAAKDYEEGIEIAEKGLSGLNREEDRRQWAKEKGDLYRGLIDVFLQQKKDLEALQLWEWYQGRSFASETGFQGASLEPRWAEIEQTVLQQPLPLNTETRLVYASTRNHLHLWMIGRAGINTVSVAEKREDLLRKVRHYLRDCSLPQNPALRLPEPDAESKQLFSLLLAPAVRYLQDSETLVVNLDLAMNALPLEALKSPEGWYFGERFPIVYSPGYLKEKELREPTRQAPHRGLLVNALSQSEDFANLLPETTIVEGAAINPADLPGLLEPHEIFVFIGHGESGALILNNNALVMARHFPPKALAHLQLAVLAACSSATTENGILDTTNLVHAFQSGGTPGVVASHWNVNRETTRKLMTSLFSHLTQGEPVARALYEARKEVVREHRHPYYWAGFVLNGRA